MLKEVTCMCGWQTRGTEDEVVEAIQAHGDEVHGRRPPRGQLEAPLTSTAWSSAFVAQSLEILFTYLAEDGAHTLRPIHADTLRLGGLPERQPGGIVMDAVEAK